MKAKSNSKAAIKKWHSGFTLIELMIVVAVIAILAAIAFPSYNNYVRKARRTDAKTALLDLAARQERLFSTKNTYSDTATELGYAGVFPANVLSSGSTAYYQISVPVKTGTTFTAQASPIGAQAADVCGTYVIDQLGVQSNKAADGTAISVADCW